tara:strand:- start:363 stop:593 length:231 start_codon:yes stop_codon:yes gene_type:complete
MIKVILSLVFLFLTENALINTVNINSRKSASNVFDGEKILKEGAFVFSEKHLNNLWKEELITNYKTANTSFFIAKY